MRRTLSRSPAGSPLSRAAARLLTGRYAFLLSFVLELVAYWLGRLRPLKRRPPAS